jgi:hypothetical protein
LAEPWNTHGRQEGNLKERACEGREWILLDRNGVEWRSLGDTESVTHTKLKLNSVV